MKNPTEAQLMQFEEEGYMLLEDVLDLNENLSILEWVKKNHEIGGWSTAQIGKGDDKSVHPEQRGDSIHWLNKDDNTPELEPYWRLVDLLQHTLNRHFYLGLNFFEAHMACYPKGTFYRRHSDKHRSGSTRKVSFVFYLNDNWSPKLGGLLNIFKDDEIKATITPQIGQCVVFLSELEHEVTVSEFFRYSITGWFHQKNIL